MTSHLAYGQHHSGIIVLHVLTNVCPVLRALFPRPSEGIWAELVTILQELVNLFREMKTSGEIYCPHLPRKGPKDGYSIIARGNETDKSLVCTFPAIVKRVWESQKLSWMEELYTPAIVAEDRVHSART